MREQKPTPGWWIADNFFYKGGKALVGPFSTKEDAMTAREAIEPLSGRMDMFIDEWTTPPVELPEEPTLGWATNRNLGGTELRWWHLDDEGRRLRATGESWGWKAPEVSAFTPAVAVPAEALEELRGGYPSKPIIDKVRDFLAAVDEANDTEAGER